MGWFSSDHVPKVAWQSVVEPAGSKIGFVVVDEVVVDEVVVSVDVCTIMRGVDCMVLRVDEGGVGGLRVLREVALSGTAV